MKVTELKLKGAYIIEPDVFTDDRGYFMETFQRHRYKEHGIDHEFVQDNLSFSDKGILRGLHYQYPHSQAKLMQVLQGEILDVIVDIRRGSPTFGKWSSITLSHENKKQLLVPEGMAHGFCVLSETALFTYKCSDYYMPESEKGILWSDPDIGIDWPIDDPVLSNKDIMLPFLKDVPEDDLPSIK